MINHPTRTRERKRDSMSACERRDAWRGRHYPARDPPTHANIAGVNAGAFPAFAAAFALAKGGGTGLLSIAKYGRSGRRAA